MIKYTGVLILLVFFAACSKKSTNNTDILSNKETKSESISDKSNSFGFELFKKLNTKKEANRNVVISPLSTAMVLGMAYNGVEGETKEKFSEVLGWKDFSVNELNGYNNRLIDHLHQQSENIRMNISNSVWFDKKMNIKESFLKRNRESFNTFTSSIDTEDRSAVSIINQWVAESTDGNISEVIDNISSQDMIYILNATYFKGNWKNDFNESKTKESLFFLEDGATEPISMMWQKTDLNYYNGEGFQFVELPYEDESYCMYILLPDSNKKVDETIENLNYSSWHFYKEKLSKKRNINFGMPRFHCEHAIKMKDLLGGMGLGKLFVRDKTDLSGITERKVAISEMMHKAAVDVDEKGTEASAATSLAISFTTLVEDNPFNLIVNRPFVFAIEEKKSNTLLFIGKVTNP